MSCIFEEDSFLFSHRFLSLSLHFLTSIEVPIHLFGVYLIYYQTPKTMLSAKYSILRLHIASSFMDIYLSFLLVFYLWIPSPSGFPVGMLSYLGVNPAIQMCICCNVLIAVALSVVAFFENRYDAVVIGQIVNAVSSSAYIAYIFWNLPDPEDARRRVHKSRPCIPASVATHPMYVNLNVDDQMIPLISASLIIIVTVQGGYFVVYTIYHLFFAVRSVSKVTQRIQKKFFVAMLLQVSIPLVAFLGPLLYYVTAWHQDYYNQKYNNIAMIVSGFHGLLTTIVMISVHAPYRRTVSDVLGFVRNRKEISGQSRIFVTNHHSPAMI